jgi:exopolyphosphatase/guanosine-5'-triphosphate,3'-diphosphate pyrophosphatase
MTLGRRRPDGSLEEFGWASETVRLGTDVAKTGRLADDRMEAAIEALRRFADQARAQGATTLVGVATEATRRARNGAEFLARVESETGWKLTAISGEEEAELTFRGLQQRLDTTGLVLVADIGGGSTELVAARDGRILHAESRPLGSGSLTDRYEPADPPTAMDIDVLREAARRELREADLPTDESLHLVVDGGTGEYAARLAGHDQELTADEIEAILQRLTTIPANELAVQLGVPPLRARVLPAGIAIIAALCDIVHPQKIDVAPSGIRTGLLLSILAPDEQVERNRARPEHAAQAGRGKHD